jgi:DNA-binding LacI/PurR family transcriptional regulator
MSQMSAVHSVIETHREPPGLPLVGGVAVGGIDGAELARRMESDIRRRGLAAGTRYLSTRQAAKRFGVSSATASQAMQALVAQGVLERRARSGTYVAVNHADAERSLVETIVVFSPRDRGGFSTVPADLLLEALFRTNPGVAVQFVQVSLNDDAGYARRLLEPVLSSGRLAGVVATSCSREVYSMLISLRLPVVVLGSLDAEHESLVSIDIDNFQSSRLLAEYLIGQGHKRLALFSVGHGRPGDFAFHEGVVEAITAAQLPANALITRLLPADPELFRSQARTVLSQPDRPSGIICRGERMLDAVADEAQSLGLQVGVDVELVFEAFATPRVTHSNTPHVQTRASFEEIGDRIGRLLRQQRDGQPVTDGRIVLPVELRVSSPGTGRPVVPVT